MKHKHEHIKEIEQIMKMEKLISLSDNDYTYKNINVLAFDPSDISNCNSSFKKFHHIKNVWDLIKCNNDLKLFTAYLFYYRPLINNPIDESYLLEGNFFFNLFSEWC